MSFRKTNQTRSRVASPLESGPVEVAKFFKNRSGEIVRVELRNFEGRDLVDLRICVADQSGKVQPTSRGIALAIVRLPELARAINKALSMAGDLGLIGCGDG